MSGFDMSGIKMLILDVDGVLTDGKIFINPRGEETKSFNTRDGLGIKMLIKSGVEVAIISGRSSAAVDFRAKELGIKEVHQGIKDKKGVCIRLMKDRGLKKGEAAAVGDDIVDLDMFDESGLGIAVADAPKEILDAADLVTGRKGGEGAVREVCEWILKGHTDGG